MKCIKCSEDNKLKERKENSGCCKKCKHPFAFDPKLGDKFTDQFFAHTLEKISVNDSLYFTPRQFYYWFNLRNKSFNYFWPAAILLFVAIGVLLIFYSSTGLIISAGFGLVGIVFLLFGFFDWRDKKGGRIVNTSLVETHKLLDRWQQKNGSVSKLLPPPQIQALPASVNPEVSAYSFDRAVICDRNEIAHFLIANNFHFENNCAVLSVNGYPNSIFETVLVMLKRNSELKVYALHDASPPGVQLIHRLRTQPRWFADSAGVTIFDLGLLPRQLTKKKMFVLKTNESAQQAHKISAEVKATLQADEIKWLEEGKHVELESLSPLLLLRILRDGIAKSRNPQADDALVMVDGGGYYGNDVSVYSVDSFG